jgi:membrane protease YdiL (CAAX protease family)
MILTNARIRPAIEILVVLAVLLLSRDWFAGFPYRNAWFMLMTLTTIFLLIGRQDGWLRDLGLGLPGSWKRFFLWLIIALAGTVLIGLVLYPLLASLLPAQNARELSSEATPPNVLLTLFLVGWFAAAFGEEVVFRGFILPRLAGLFGAVNAGWWLAILLQAFVFGLLHSTYLGMAVAALFGILYGTVFWLSGRQLWPVILAHALPDTISILSGG